MDALRVEEDSVGASPPASCLGAVVRSMSVPVGRAESVGLEAVLGVLSSVEVEAAVLASNGDEMTATMRARTRRSWVTCA